MSKYIDLKRCRVVTISISFVVTSVALSVTCLGQQGTQSGKAESALVSEPKVDTQIELARQQFEFQKELESKKLEIERQKAWTTGGSILLPLLLGSLGIYLQVRSAFKLKAQELSKAQELKEQEFKSAFELKAADIVLNTTSPRVGKSKAEILQELFPGRLPPDFAKSFESRMNVKPGEQRPLGFEHTQLLLQMLSHNIGKEREVVESWCKVYPYYQEWLEVRFPKPSSKANSDADHTLESNREKEIEGGEV